MSKNFALHTSRSASGQMCGSLYDGDVKVGEVAGYSCVDEVIQAAFEAYGVEVDHVIDAQTGEVLSQLFRYKVFSERDGVSARLSSYCICPPGFAPPGPERLWRKIDVSRELLDVHPIFRRAGWYFFGSHEPDNDAIRFACSPTSDDRIACLINELLRPGFPQPADLPSKSYYLPDLPPELLVAYIDLTGKLAVIDSMLQVPTDFEVQFLYTLRKAIEAALVRKVWPFWNET